MGVSTVWDRLVIRQAGSVVCALSLYFAIGATVARGATIAPVTVVSDANGAALFANTNWDAIPSVSDFHDIETHADASAKTTCRFVRSSSDLLARCTAYEIPHSTKASTDPAAIQNGDYIALIVSTRLDVRAPGMYIFFVNPLNIHQSMGTLPDAATVAWKSSVDTTPISWSVNFDVPFASFSLPPVSDQTWRVSIMRQDTTSRTVFTWPGVPVADPAKPSGQAVIPDLTVR